MWAVALGLFVAASFVAPAGASAADPLTARYIVRLAPGGSDVDALAGRLLAVIGGARVVTTYEHSIRGFAVELPAAAAPLLGLLPGVIGVEADSVVTLADTQEPASSYGLDRIDQRTLPLDGGYTWTSAGAGVTAYVVDTGIRATHVDFTGRVRPGASVVPEEPTTGDCNGHGTHVAGTLGGAVHGVARAVTIVPVRVFGCGNTTLLSTIIDGVDWIAGDHVAGDPAVANFSIAGGPSPAYDDAVRALIAEGITVVAAAGNGDANGPVDACTSSPNTVPEVLVAGATDRADARAGFSNTGPCVDLHAPGVDIVSAGIVSDTSTAIASGTSMAAPAIAGAAARYLSSNPAASPADVYGFVVGTATPGAQTGPGLGAPPLVDSLLGPAVRAQLDQLFRDVRALLAADQPDRLLYVDPSL